MLLYSPADIVKWRQIMENPRDGAEAPPPEVMRAQRELLEQLRRYCQPFVCRHRQLVEYFGQAYDKSACEACDVCLDENGEFEDATITAQKILSCVARVQERFGPRHVIDVLRGGDTEMIRKWTHHKLSTYGLLKDVPRKVLNNQLNQLIDLGLLERSDGEFATLTLNDASWEVMRGQRRVMLQRQAEQRERAEVNPQLAWEGVDRGLFDALRRLRRSMSEERGVPPFVIFNDASLRDMARRRPQGEAAFRRVHGVGAAKWSEFGGTFLACIREYCSQHGLAENTSTAPRGRARLPQGRTGPQDGGGLAGGAASRDADTYAHHATETAPVPRSASQSMAKALFARGRTVEEVMAEMARARSTVMNYLSAYIEDAAPPSIDAWVPPEIQRRVLAAADQQDDKRLTPIFEALGGDVPYDYIRLVLAHRRAMDNGPRLDTNITR